MPQPSTPKRPTIIKTNFTAYSNSNTNNHCNKIHTPIATAHTENKHPIHLPISEPHPTHSNTHSASTTSLPSVHRGKNTIIRPKQKLESKHWLLISNQKRSAHQTPKSNQQGTPHPQATEEDTKISHTNLQLDTNSWSRSKSNQPTRIPNINLQGLRHDVRWESKNHARKVNMFSFKTTHLWITQTQSKQKRNKS